MTEDLGAAGLAPTDGCTVLLGLGLETVFAAVNDGAGVPLRWPSVQVLGLRRGLERAVPDLGAVPLVSGLSPISDLVDDTFTVKYVSVASASRCRRGSVRHPGVGRRLGMTPATGVVLRSVAHGAHHPSPIFSVVAVEEQPRPPVGRP